MLWPVKRMVVDAPGWSVHDSEELYEFGRRGCWTATSVCACVSSLRLPIQLRQCHNGGLTALIQLLAPPGAPSSMFHPGLRSTLPSLHAVSSIVRLVPLAGKTVPNSPNTPRNTAEALLTEETLCKSTRTRWRPRGRSVMEVVLLFAEEGGAVEFMDMAEV